MSQSPRVSHPTAVTKTLPKVPEAWVPRAGLPKLMCHRMGGLWFAQQWQAR